MRSSHEFIGPVVLISGLVAWVAVIAVAAFHALDDLISALVSTVAPWLLVAAMVVAVLATLGRGGHSHGHARMVRRGRDITVHTGPTHDLKVAAKHEASHAVVARKVGWTVRSVQVNPDGSGVTRIRIPSGSRYRPEHDVAVSLAGGIGSKTWRGCGSDLGHARAAAREGSAEWREGERIARSALFWGSGRRDSDARKLLNRGHL